MPWLKTAKTIILFAFLAILIGHGAYTTLIPVLLINIGTLFILIFWLYNVFINKRKAPFSLVAVLYIANHFDILGNFGGLFVLVSFGVIVVYYFSTKRFVPFPVEDRVMKTLLIVLIGSNILGWVLYNESDFLVIANGILIFATYILMFNFVRQQNLSIFHFNIFIFLMLFMQCYESLVALNTYLGLIKTDTAFFPTASRFGSYFTEGTINHSELFGELAMLTSIISLVYLSATNKQIEIPKKILITGLFASLLNVFLSGSRSALFLTALGMIIFYFASNIRFNKLFTITASARYLLLGASVFIMLWTPLNLRYGIDRFTDEKKGLNVTELSEANILTGEGTPREGAFLYFFDRYADRDNWIVGYGLGTITGNRQSWFKDPTEIRADYHSLYLSIIILYGWAGSWAFIMIFMVTIVRLFLVIKWTNKNKHFIKYFYPALSFVFLLILLLLNEYKISFLRIPSYHMLVWIWLGMSNALYYSVKRSLKNENSLASSISH